MTTKRKGKEKLHRGRFQAQGARTKKSVAWTLPDPETKSHAYNAIVKLKSKLSPAALNARFSCFEKACKYIENAPALGVTAFVKRSFYPCPPDEEVRVDLDILAGIALKDD